MMMELDDDAERIEEALVSLRREIAIYHQKYGKFYRSAFDGLPSVPRNELLLNCRLVNDRHELIRLLPSHGVFAEVGTLYGDFIVRVIEINQPKEIHIFDFGTQNIRESNRKILDKHGSVKYHIGESSENMSNFPDNYFDVIYIDADHTFEGVWKDLMQARKKIKRGGYIVCNDYTNFDTIQLVPYGVYSAVNKFVNEYNYHVEFFALSPMGFHDVALRSI